MLTLDKGHSDWLAMFASFQCANTNSNTDCEIIQYDLVYKNQMSISRDNAFVFCTHQLEKHQEVLRKK